MFSILQQLTNTANFSEFINPAIKLTKAAAIINIFTRK